MPLLKELTAIEWLLSYKHCAPNGASAAPTFSRFALRRAGCPRSADKMSALQTTSAFS